MKLIVFAASISLLGTLVVGLDNLKTTPKSQSLLVSTSPQVEFKRGDYRIVKIKYDRAAQISEKDLRQILEKVGFTGNGLEMALAIAYYESTFRPASLNRSSNCYGLFQINMSGSMGPDRRRKYGLSKNEDLFNPIINATVAYKMSNGGKNWSAWTTKGMAEAKVNN